MSIAVLPARLPQKLLVVVCLLSGFGLAAALNDAGFIHLPAGGVFSNLFNVNKETTIPAWFSSALLLLVAYHGFLASQLRSAHVQRFRGLWQLFALLFLLLSVDEAAGLHERLQSAMTKNGGGGLAESIKFVWVLPFLGGCALLAVAYLRFVVALPNHLRWRLVVAGAMYIGGAAGMELVGGVVFTHFGNGLFYLLMTVLEETLEMSGAIFCLHTLTLMLEAEAPALFLKSATRARLPIRGAVSAN